jgi:hypothetical protein
MSRVSGLAHADVELSADRTAPPVSRAPSGIAELYARHRRSFGLSVDASAGPLPESIADGAAAAPRDERERTLARLEVKRLWASGDRGAAMRRAVELLKPFYFIEPPPPLPTWLAEAPYGNATSWYGRYSRRVLSYSLRAGRTLLPVGLKNALKRLAHKI